MRIGIICYPSYGGSGVIATELGKRLAKRGHEVHFVSYDRPFKLNIFHQNIFYHEVEVLEYPLFKFPPYMIALASKIAEVSKWANLDLVHVHYAIPHAVSAFLAKQLVTGRNLPFVTTLHGTDITIVGNEPQFWDITKFSIEASDAVTTVSRSLREETMNVFKISRDVEVIYNFIDAEEYRRVEVPELRSRFAAAEEKILIHISNFRPVKRLRDVVDIFAAVSREVPSRLLMVGDGPDGPAVHQYIASKGLTDRVHFLGMQERVVELLSISDLCLLPSEKESFGLVALEAMACGVPVIASMTGGLPEIVRNGETGFLLPVGNVEAMALEAVRILTDYHLWEQLSQNGVSHAVNNFGIDKIVNEYEQMYARVISQK
ncbi:MAG: N-acetyl-alpha-D-glucosaminyl L-malate synthase BshA [Thermincola sp.]|jgi:N-acetyl-alpha-D-glucosaminyl L-malate synthase BshA|nr:N-acetyl-alpha-D-glucosaminyl L-malate synthase BshA [Thermincola sp.]